MKVGTKITDAVSKGFIVEMQACKELRIFSFNTGEYLLVNMGQI